MRPTNFDKEQELSDFAKRAAESFTNNPHFASYSDKAVDQSELLALRWGLGKDCVLVLTIDTEKELVLFENVVDTEKENNNEPPFTEENIIKEALIELRGAPPIDSREGICVNLRKKLKEKTKCRDVVGIGEAVSDILRKYWARYSGDFPYPIPHSLINPRAAYHQGENMWSQNSLYGQYRLEALDCLIEHSDNIKYQINDIDSSVSLFISKSAKTHISEVPFNPIKTALQNLIEKPPKNNIRKGVCSLFHREFKRLTQTVRGEGFGVVIGDILATYWDKYSGDFEYPIPHPSLDPETAFNYFAKWDKDTQYGLNRYEAIQCLIEHSDKIKYDIDEDKELVTVWVEH